MRHVICVWCLLLPGAALAARSHKIEKLVAEGRVHEAAELGQDWLSDGKHPSDHDRLALAVEHAAYLDATHIDTEPAYVAFISEYPHGSFTDRAWEQLSAVAWKRIGGTASLADLQQFQASYPASSFVPEARLAEESLAWQTTRAVDDDSTYASFRAAWPGGRFVAAAAERQAELAYRKVREEDDLDAMLAYLAAWPDSRFAADVRTRCEDLAWQRATTSRAVGDWRAFRQAFPGTERAKRAASEELALAWSATAKAHRGTTYRSFELDYPATDEALVAEDREWSLYHYTRDPYPGELLATPSRVRRRPDGTWGFFVDVRERGGNVVGGLAEPNFRVYDAGYEAKIVEFAGMETNRPVDVIFVVDISGSMKDEIESVKGGILRFADLMTLRSRDLRLGLVTFVEQVEAANGLPPSKLGPLSNDPRQFQRWVEDIGLGQGSEEDHFQAIELASNLPMRPDAQHIVVLVSDEEPTFRRRWRDVASIAKLMTDRDVEVLAITLPSTNFSTLAQTTGGDLLPMDKLHPFAVTMEELAQRISKQYRLVIQRPEGAPPVVDDLKLKLRVQADQVWIADAAPLASGLVASAFAASGTTLDTWMAVEGGGMYCSADGGQTWVTCGAGLPAEAVVELIAHPENPKRLYARTAAGAGFASEDGGVTFTSATPGHDPVLGFCARSPSTWWVTDGARIWSGPDAWGVASRWVPPSPITALGCSLGGSVVVRLADGTAWRSEDGGQSFDLAGAPWALAGAPDGFAYHPGRRGLAFAWGPGGLWRSLDGGGNWRLLSLPGNPGAYGVSFDLSQRQWMLAYTSLGVFSSADLGRTWTKQAAGLEGRDPTRVRAGVFRGDGRAALVDMASASMLSMERVANREFVFSSVFFASGSAEPHASLRPHLDDLARYLLKNRKVILRVEGHTDADGADDANLVLSQKRATWVCDYLAQQGVPRAQLKAVGYGERHPLFANTTVEGRARNRRVEMLLVAPNEPIPAMKGMQ